MSTSQCGKHLCDLGPDPTGSRREAAVAPLDQPELVPDRYRQGHDLQAATPGVGIDAAAGQDGIAYAAQHRLGDLADLVYEAALPEAVRSGMRFGKIRSEQFVGMGEPIGMSDEAERVKCRKTLRCRAIRRQEKAELILTHTLPLKSGVRGRMVGDPKIETPRYDLFQNARLRHRLEKDGQVGGPLKSDP